MDQIESLLDRPKAYYNIDGLGELGGSVMLLGAALLLWLAANSPANSVWHQISVFVFIALALVIRSGTKALKRRVTYPRTGFIQYRKSDCWRPRIIAFLLSALIPVALVAADRRKWDITTPAPLTGLVFVAVYAYTFARAVRWKWVVVWAIVLASFVMAFVPTDVLATLADDSLVTHPVRAKIIGTMILSFLTYGPLLLISGGISFWLYLRHTEAPAQEAE